MGERMTLVQSGRSRLSSSKGQRVRARIRRDALAASPWAGPREAPSYFIVGCKRGGTSSLHEYLVQHPDVIRALTVKGTRFFDVNYDRGFEWFVRQFPTSRSVDRAERTRGTRPIVGDASPYYGFHPDAPGRIADRYPDAKLILLVREPVARAWSHYSYERARGVEHLAFPEALAKEAERLADGDGTHSAAFCHRHFAYRTRSCYAAEVRHILDHFPAEQLLVLESEFLFEQPQAAMSEIFSHCGLAPFSGDFTEVVKGNTYSGLDPDLRAELTAFYEPHNADLESLLGRTLRW